MSAYPKFYFRPSRGEQINTVITPVEDPVSSICGKVADARGKAVDRALVLLFRADTDSGPELLARGITDEDGQFLFGPLEPEQLYLVKVFKNDAKLRELEIRTD